MFVKNLLYQSLIPVYEYMVINVIQKAVPTSLCHDCCCLRTWYALKDSERTPFGVRSFLRKIILIVPSWVTKKLLVRPI